MKEQIEQIKQENGNKNFNSKDLTWYLISEVRELRQDIKKLGESRVSWKVFIPTITLMVGFSMFLLKEILQLRG